MGAPLGTMQVGSRSLRVVGDFAIDAEVTTRGYTTRAKEEQRRTAAPVFTGRVRRWERRWGQVGHMALLRWERVGGDSEERTDYPLAPAASSSVDACSNADETAGDIVVQGGDPHELAPSKRIREGGAEGDEDDADEDLLETKRARGKLDPADV